MPQHQIPSPAKLDHFRQARLMAPAWHLAGVLFLICGLIAASSRLRHFGGAGHANHRLIGYSFMIAAEWIITGFIWWGCRLRNISISALIGDFPLKWRAVLKDLGIAVAFLVLANIVLAVIGHVAHATPTQSMRNILPRTDAEVVVYLLLSLTAAVCEEIIYRGYIQQQFSAVTRSATGGIIIQSIIFGISHAYQGPRLILTTAIYGSFFGLLARWRRSLRPGMMAHFLQDGVGGLILARYALR